jgi:putative oxidoreductase
MQILERVQKISYIGLSASEKLQPIVALATRFVLGHAFVLTGIGKWRHFDDTVDFFDGLGIPAPAANAAFVASLELVGGILLMLGLGTRLVSTLLASTMIVALATADRGDFLAAFAWTGAEKGLLDIVPFVFLAFLGWLVAHGAGPLSVDRLVFGRACRTQHVALA